MTEKGKKDELAALTQEMIKNAEGRSKADLNTHKATISNDKVSEYTGKPKYFDIFGRLLHYLAEENYDAIITELTNLYFDDLLPMTDYDMYCTTPYSDEVSRTYGLPYRINASFIRTKFLTYIACQKPKEKYCQHFIRFANDASDIIVCLCNRQDDYFTSSASSSTTADILRNNPGLATKDGHQDADKDGSVYVIEDMNNTRRIKFLKWEDFDVPHRKDFTRFYDAYLSMNKSDKPVIVHCKAGVGRTGTFILYDTLARMENVTNEIFIDELCKMREQRNFMVFNGKQLKWLADIFLEKTDK
ncbi:hypothetical protein VCUG_00783 [Vavraia culicis subsp. floridensis]|uniref:Protein-tyrosine-phosphatase n=1 Tax=Vavraia culicis (isolate floridensis) TaxID=948595 RepID=L2GVJ9_VAVCU|nr:uncharacterized protein VCUG_00783 [Vavraia culicis subsp. floridensis]ELA47701.1 hypothetical protein VCUG_00783 [Vavraia culicis subsp. floridensis]